MPRSINQCCAALLKPFLGFVEEDQREEFLAALCPEPEEVDRLFDSINHPSDLESWGHELISAGLEQSELIGNGDVSREAVRHRLTGRLIAELLLPEAGNEPGYRPANGNGRYWNVLFLASTLEPVMLELLDRGRKFPPKRGGERRVRDLAERFHAVIDGDERAVPLQRMLMLWRLILPFDKMAVRRGLAYRAFPRVRDNITGSPDGQTGSSSDALDRPGFDFVIARVLSPEELSARLDQLEHHLKPGGTGVLQLSPRAVRGIEWDPPDSLTTERAFGIELDSSGALAQVLVELSGESSDQAEKVEIRRARISTRDSLEADSGPGLRLSNERRELAPGELFSGLEDATARG